MTTDDMPFEEERAEEEPAEEERAPLATSLKKLCFMIVKAREFDAEVPSDEGEAGSNPADDREVSVLEDSAENTVFEELTAALDGLDDDERTEVLALVWLGRGDGGADDWPALLEEARAVQNRRETAYLTGIPQLGDLLEEGLAALGYSCREYEIGRL